MPFTVSHAAAAWPLRALLPRLPLVALIVGTLSPDFEYLYRLAPVGRTFHNASGVLFFCLPASLVVLVVLDRVVRPYLAQWWPTLTPHAAVPAQSVWGVAAAVIAGAGSHVFWDGFTHRTDFGVATFPALLSSVSLPFGHVEPVYRLLQHGSTVVGGAVLGAWTASAWWRASAASRRECVDGFNAACPALVAITVASAAAAIANGIVGNRLGPYFAVSYAAVGGMFGVVVAVLVPACLHKWRGRKTGSTPLAGGGHGSAPSKRR